MYTSYNEACAMQQSSLADDLLLCDKAGFDYIEIRFDMLAKYLRTHTPAELRGFFDAHHIKPHMLNAFYLDEDFLTDRMEPAKNQAMLEQFLYACSIAREIGAPGMIVVSSFTDDGTAYGAEWLNAHYADRLKSGDADAWMSHTDFKEPEGNTGKETSRVMSRCGSTCIFNEDQSSIQAEAQKALNKAVRQHAVENHVRMLTHLSKLAEPYGIKLALELVGMEKAAVGDIDTAKEVIERVGKDNVGYAMDIVNIYIKNHDEADFEKLRSVDPAKIFAFHVNNADDADIKVQAQRTLPDRGVLCVKRVIGILREIGYEGMLSVETFRPEYFEWDAERVVKEAYVSCISIS